MGARLIDAGVH